jgi:prepilin-type N-terminal cleavage/methylation domain-containing protein
MKPRIAPRRQTSGMTLFEMMIAIGIGSIVLTMVSLLYLFGLRSFAAMGNYAELDGKSRHSLDVMSREMRQATHVIAAQNSGTTHYITLANLAISPTVTNKYTWDGSSKTLVWEHWEAGTITTQTNLTGCSSWTFSMYSRAPDTNGEFVVTSDKTMCKLINLNWKCSRTVIGQINSEAVLTAQIVLRNKQ